MVAGKGRCQVAGRRRRALFRAWRLSMTAREPAMVPICPPPPRHGSSPAPNVCGGAQRGVSLATGFFTGESKRNPLRGSHLSKLQYINDLLNHDLGVLDSFAESRESTLRKPCVDASRCARKILTFLACDRVRSCVRPHRAAFHMPRAGMEMRGSGPNHHDALTLTLWLPLAFLIPI